MRFSLERCVLRPWRPDDLDSLVAHANNWNVARNLRDRFAHPYTRAHGEAWLAAVASVPGASFAIEVDGAAAGGIGVHPGEGIYRRSAELGYWLGEPFWGRGIATEAVRAVTEWAFDAFDLVRVQANVFAPNVASARVLEKAGFEYEGRRRKAVVKAGEILDELLYARVR